MHPYLRERNVEGDLSKMIELLERDKPPSMDDVQNEFGGARVEYFHYLIFRAVREKLNAKDKDRKNEVQ